VADLFIALLIYPFRSFIDHFGIIDVGFVGNPFTWSNNK
jgi:hypothetical protein